MKLLPERESTPYDDPAKAEAYREGYRAWPGIDNLDAPATEYGKPSRGSPLESPWLTGWHHARYDDPRTRIQGFEDWDVRKSK